MPAQLDFPTRYQTEEGDSDKAKVSVIIKAPTDRTLAQSRQDQVVQGNQHEL